MRKAEFDKLTSKGDWRRRFAVWKSWNENGEYVTYTVPPGQPLKVWEGRAATQINSGAPEYSLEGGAVQIVLDPSQLKKEFTGRVRIQAGAMVMRLTTRFTRIWDCRNWKTPITGMNLRTKTDGCVTSPGMLSAGEIYFT